MKAAAYLFGDSRPSDGAAGRWSRATWTVIGSAAIPLWATWPTLAALASPMPVFQLLAIAFTIGTVTLYGMERRSAATESVRPSLSSRVVPAVACSFGLLGADAFFVLATASIPAAQANLISYLWPMMVVGLGAIAGFFPFRARHASGLIIGFCGAGVVIGGNGMTFSAAGIGLAGLSGLSWALFCLFRLYQGGKAQSALVAGCGLSAALSLILHLILEPTIVPSALPLLSAFAVGVALALGNLLWDQGLRRGDSRLLAVMAYATPLVGALILIIADLATPTWNLLFGGLLIVGAGLVSRDRTTS
jgi:drug/metabolite transporter (DMT)-like permease